MDSIRLLKTVVSDIADSLVDIDKSREQAPKAKGGFYQAGVGPFPERLLLSKVCKILGSKAEYKGTVEIGMKCPDLLIRGSWALEFKIARPFGDNGREAENWSVNLLHPYKGNTSSLGDCQKLLESNRPERKAVVVIGYEHDPTHKPLAPLVDSFELLAERIMKVKLGPRVTENRKNLIHPVLQQVTVYGWEVCGTI
jgi:hypothetical protein